MTGDPSSFPALPPIGRAVDGTRVLVLDARLRPVPPGVRGEVYVGGICLAEGYLGRPDLTAERFIDDPFGAAGEILYRTGDLGLVLPGGDIVCVGRTDTQVKVRGHRVETAEVELALLTAARDGHPGLREAAVVDRSHPGGDTFLAAFLVGDPNRVDVDALRARLRAVLPEYMAPTRFGWLPALPLTPSGKRDDAALRRIALAAADVAPDARPATAHERVLAEIVADLIQVPEVGVHDDIFDLGATSLTTMRLVVTIEQRYGVNVPVSAVLQAPTVAQLARRLGPAEELPAFDPLVPIRPGGDRPPLFLVHPMGGNVLCYLPLARHLPDDQPLYALQAAGADPGTEPLRSMEALAASYVEAVRRVQPQGPYRIGGWSFGGYAAFEMARQLRAAGEEVADLFVLDTTAVIPGERHRHRDDELLVWFFWELLLLERGGRSPIEAIPVHHTTLSEKFEYIAELAIAEGVLPAGSSGVVVRRLFDVYAANWNAVLNYRPGRAALDLTLIRAAEPLPRELRPMHDAIGTQYNDEANGWRELIDGRVEVVKVPGDHLTMVEEPHVGKVADAMLSREEREPTARR
jgi:thioesterase domain-containing protein/acyl carrier protein